MRSNAPKPAAGLVLTINITTMKTELYYLVDPNDDTGNDDGILDRLEMTQAEAKARNDENRRNNIDRRWVKAKRAPLNLDLS